MGKCCEEDGGRQGKGQTKLREICIRALRTSVSRGLGQAGRDTTGNEADAVAELYRLGFEDAASKPQPLNSASVARVVAPRGSPSVLYSGQSARKRLATVAVGRGTLSQNLPF